jgi:hypothetical protein
MMLLVGLLSMLATLSIQAIIFKFSSLGMGWAFLLSWIGVFLCAGALAAKEHAIKKPISAIGRWTATFLAALPVAGGFQSFLELWHSGSGIWFTLLLLWFALLSVMSIWVPLQAAEE